MFGPLFGSWDVEKMHAVVARSTFRSQNVQITPLSDHSWMLRCRKSARRCGAKHISKSKCTNHTIVRPLLDVEMSKKCTPLWREAHVQVKMYKTHHVRTTVGSWDVEKVHAVVARSTFRSQNVKNTRGSDHFWRFRCRFASLHYTTLHYTPLHYTYITLHNTPQHYNYNYTTKLHYTPLHTLSQTKRFKSVLFQDWRSINARKVVTWHTITITSCTGSTNWWYCWYPKMIYAVKWLI